MLQNVKRGFTLIELLVVIAIIAILAAILFPVFAQARAAARGASSQSNLKQLSLAVIMYEQDYDETYPLFQRWGDPSSAISIGQPFSMWSYDILPYLKNYQVFADPQYGTLRTQDVFVPLFTSYGYDYTVLSPSTSPSAPYICTPATLAAIARPAEIVLLGGRFAPEEYAGYGTIYWYGPGTMVNAGNVEAPDCSDIPPWCWTDWTPNGNDNILTTEESGLYTGGNSARKAHTLNLAFCDGHVKFYQEGQGAAGTNWFKGIGPGAVHVTDKTKYMWEQSP